MAIKNLRPFALFVAGMGFGAMLGFFHPTVAVAAFAFGLWVWAILTFWESIGRVTKKRWLVVIGSFFVPLLIVIYLPSKLSAPEIDESKIRLFL